MKVGGISLQPQSLLASQEGLYSMRLVINHTLFIISCTYSVQKEGTYSLVIQKLWPWGAGGVHGMCVRADDLPSLQTVTN